MHCKYFDDLHERNDLEFVFFFVQKSVVALGDGRRLISKGSIFHCTSAVSGTADVQLYCCGSDYCNSSIRRGGSSIVLLLFTVLRIYM